MSKITDHAVPVELKAAIELFVKALGTEEGDGYAAPSEMVGRVAAVATPMAGWAGAITTPRGLATFAWNSQDGIAGPLIPWAAVSGARLEARVDGTERESRLRLRLRVDAPDLDLGAAGTVKDLQELAQAVFDRMP